MSKPRLDEGIHHLDPPLQESRPLEGWSGPDLKGLTGPETEAWCEGQGLPAYRGRQIRRWLFKKGATSFHDMTSLPKALREELAQLAVVDRLQRSETRISQDGTEKILFRLPEGHRIESVLIPERDHFTLCISSQAGCAMGCRFCVTGLGGLKRNLAAGEIVDQVVQVRRSMARPERLTNIVFMGMGEPLANDDAVVRAIHNLTCDDALNFSHRRVTLSTSGLVPAMERLGRDANVNLAVSLNAADDDTRDFLMPINRRYPLNRLMAACRAFPLPNRRMITFEYILIRDINDRETDARRLVRLLRGLRAKINLIPLNPHPSLELSPSPPDRIQTFQEVLTRNHYTAIVRKSKGQDISAACGQLSGEPPG
ncbi:MAG: 23S rRNA (adenine(2503)-C(2))-methyltransferase RlmN [Deltaproteobacteria bacterium]|nr:23S rRNA (adenine(2503)-C(2))-methyltransferase RlmN [Deltaproteobacteria bacterium]